MSGEWRDTELGSVLRVDHGFAFKGEHFGTGGSARLVTPGNFCEAGGFRDRGDAQKTYDGPVPTNFVLSPGEVVVAMTEQSPGLLGSAGLVPEDGQTWLHNQRIGRVRLIDPTETDERFIYYLFNSPSVRAQLSATATGTKVRHTAPERIYSVRAPLPGLDIQRAVGKLLSAFDEMIEIDQRRIEVLEDLARSLYREWFVRFRFPGHEDSKFVDSELGPIPEGWEVKPCAEVFDFIGGGTPSKKEAAFWEEGVIRWYTPSDLTRSRTRHCQPSELCITEVGLARSSARLFPAGSVLMTSRATLGVLSIAVEESTCNQGFIVFLPKDPFPSSYMYEWLADHAGDLEAIATGATFKEITKGALKRFPAMLPPADVLLKFAAKAEPLSHSIGALEAENRSLAATRDLLLPRLVTGKLDISEIDLGVLTPSEAA